MLTRRHLRIKVLQEFYAFFLNPPLNLSVAEKQLLNNINKTYDLFLHQLMLIIKIRNFAEYKILEAKNKFYPSKNDINPNTKFINNAIIKMLSNNKNLEHTFKKRKIFFNNEDDFIPIIFKEIKTSKLYNDYMKSDKISFKEDKKFIINMYNNIFVDNNLLAYIYEEKHIYWADDFELIHQYVINFINSLKKNKQDINLPKLFKDKSDELFLFELFRNCILKCEEYSKYIYDKSQNWDPDRIILLDKVIMLMAITELCNFPSIPIKVTLNEYIELAKDYSTYKSKNFVNGILDQLLIDLKKRGLIIKEGRGLLQN